VFQSLANIEQVLLGSAMSHGSTASSRTSQAGKIPFEIEFVIAMGSVLFLAP